MNISSLVNHRFMSYSEKISQVFEGLIFIGYSQYIVTRLIFGFKQNFRTYHHPYNQCEKFTSCGFYIFLIIFIKPLIRLEPDLKLKHTSTPLIRILLRFTIASLFLSSRILNIMQESERFRI